MKHISRIRRTLHHEWMVVGAVVSIALVVGSFALMNLVKANADYICTYIIDETSDCGNGSWSSWQPVGSSNDEVSCVTTNISERTYTGTRVIRHVLQYLNLRTACDGDYSQSGNGDGGGGASGFHGGSVITEYSACQIIERQTTRARYTGGSCAAKTPTIIPGTETQVSRMEGDVQRDSQDVYSKSALDTFRESMIKATITAIPSLVRSGNPTVVRWQGREVKNCTVSGQNGDGTGSNATGVWAGTSGEQKTSAITQPTTYTLTCTAFNGKLVESRAQVDLVPVFEEN